MGRGVIDTLGSVFLERERGGLKLDFVDRLRFLLESKIESHRLGSIRKTSKEKENAKREKSKRVRCYHS